MLFVFCNDMLLSLNLLQINIFDFKTGRTFGVYVVRVCDSDYAFIIHRLPVRNPSYIICKEKSYFIVSVFPFLFTVSSSCRLIPIDKMDSIFSFYCDIKTIIKRIL